MRQAQSGSVPDFFYEATNPHPMTMHILIRPLRVPGFFCGLLALGLPVFGTGAAEPPNPDAEKFLVPYEQVLKALVDDNLDAAKQAAHTLPNGVGDDLEKAKDLKAAREAFSTLSQTAEKMAAGVPGYHVFYCPMAKKDWVQQATVVANPYEGKEMLTCGVEKK